MVAFIRKKVVFFSASCNSYKKPWQKREKKKRKNSLKKRDQTIWTVLFETFFHFRLDWKHFKLQKAAVIFVCIRDAAKDKESLKNEQKESLEQSSRELQRFFRALNQL